VKGSAFYRRCCRLTPTFPADCARLPTYISTRCGLIRCRAMNFTRVPPRGMQPLPAPHILVPTRTPFKFYSFSAAFADSVLVLLCGGVFDAPHPVVGIPCNLPY